MSSDLAALLKRLEAATAKLESLAGGAGAPAASAPAGAAASPADDSVAPSVEAFEEIINNEVAAFMASASKIGAEVAAHAELVKKAVEAQRDYIRLASKSQKPADADVPAMLKPLSEAIAAVTAFRDSKENRRTKFPNHLATVCEGIPALGWVTVTPKPVPFVKDMADAAEFYGNRVIKEFKDTDATHVEWARNYKAIFATMQEYVKKFHTTGLTWNPKGGDAKAAVSSAPTAAAPAKPAGGPPAPPRGPPPPPPVVLPAAGSSNEKPPTAALFAELSKGTAITSGLKKVDKSQMTHKNPELRASSVVKADEIKPKAAPAKTAAKEAKGIPLCTLDGKKWKIEWQDNNKDIVIDDCDMAQTVYIYKCTGSVIKINKKVNSIVLDSCKKTAVVFDTTVAGFEIVNCQSVQVQVIKSVPLVNIDKTDGVQIYLSADSLACEVFTAKSSEMNISVPGATPDADMVEHPIAEQFRTKYNATTKKFVTDIPESSG